MQRLFLASSIFVCAYVFASVALAAEIYTSSKVLPSTSQEFDQLDYSSPGMINHDWSEERTTEFKEAPYLKDVPRGAPFAKWYLVRALPASKEASGQKSNQVSSMWPLMSINSEPTKKQTHKKNNPRDILRGLAVKRDHYY